MTKNPRFKKPKLSINELENRYIDLFNRISDLIMIHDLEGRLLDVNPAVSKLSGYSKEEIEGKKKWTEFVIKEDLRRLRAYCLDQSHRRLSSLTNGEFRFMDRKGKTKDILLTIGSIADTQRSVASLLNITHRKQVEVELQKAHDELEHRIKERTADLEKANKQLQHEVKERVATEQQKEELINKLQIALSEIKKLSGLLPICASCKKIRDDRGYWNQIETYISSHSEAVFSHSLCPECMDKLYGDEDWYKKYK